jgi:hypothetical protein
LEEKGKPGVSPSLPWEEVLEGVAWPHGSKFHHAGQTWFLLLPTSDLQAETLLSPSPSFLLSALLVVTFFHFDLSALPQLNEFLSALRA